MVILKTNLCSSALEIETTHYHFLTIFKINAIDCVDHLNLLRMLRQMRTIPITRPIQD